MSQMKVASASGGVPVGGTVGQALIKNSGADNDVAWGNAANLSAPPFTILGNATNATTAVADLTATQVALLAGPALVNLTTTQIPALTAVAVASINSTGIGALVSPTLFGLGSTQINSLPSSQVTGLGALAGQSSVTSTQVNSLNAAQVSGVLNSTQLGSLNAGNLTGAVPTTSLTAVPSGAISALSTTAVSGLSMAHMTGFTSTQLVALTTTTLGSVLTPALSGIGSTQIVSLSTTQITGYSSGGAVALYAASSSGSPVTPTVGAYQGQVAIGDGATVGGTGIDAMALGNSYASGTNAFAAGGNSHSGTKGALGNYAVAIGPASVAYASCVAIGANATTITPGDVALGSGATAAYGFAVGPNAFMNPNGGGYSVCMGGSGSYQSDIGNGWGFLWGGGAAKTYLSGNCSIAMGDGAAATNYGQAAWSNPGQTQLSGNGNLTGYAQDSWVRYTGSVASASATQIYLDGVSSVFALTTGKAYAIHVRAIASDTTTTANFFSMAATSMGVAKNNGGTVTLVNPTMAVQGQSGTSATGAALSFTVSGATLQLSVTNPSGWTSTDVVHWHVWVHFIEVI